MVKILSSAYPLEAFEENHLKGSWNLELCEKLTKEVDFLIGRSVAALMRDIAQELNCQGHVLKYAGPEHRSDIEFSEQATNIIPPGESTSKLCISACYHTSIDFRSIFTPEELEGLEDDDYEALYTSRFGKFDDETEADGGPDYSFLMDKNTVACSECSKTLLTSSYSIDTFEDNHSNGNWNRKLCQKLEKEIVTHLTYVIADVMIPIVEELNTQGHTLILDTKENEPGDVDYWDETDDIRPPGKSWSRLSIRIIPQAIVSFRSVMSREEMAQMTMDELEGAYPGRFF